MTSKARDLADGVFTGTVEAPSFSDGTTTVASTYLVNGSAKAWGRYSSGTTIYDSFNVSSATNYGTGDEGITFTTAFDNVQNYTSAGLAQTVSSTAYVTSMMDNVNYRTKTASHFTYRTAWASTTAASTSFYDDSFASSVHHGDLA